MGEEGLLEANEKRRETIRVPFSYSPDVLPKYLILDYTSQQASRAGFTGKHAWFVLCVMPGFRPHFDSTLFAKSCSGWGLVNHRQVPRLHRPTGPADKEVNEIKTRKRQGQTKGLHFSRAVKRSICSRRPEITRSPTLQAEV
ncbi:hypothetical protein Bbelb_242650 [Branchiostoma belcheri]|nr:hypothetical protein Bbelb_242650 [Branchiostoma belcheri]